MFAGDRATAENAYRKAIDYDPKKDVVYGWGLQLFQDKWGGNATDLKAVAQAAANATYSKIEKTGVVIEDLKNAGFPAEAKTLGERALFPLDTRLKANPTMYTRTGRKHLSSGMRTICPPPAANMRWSPGNSLTVSKRKAITPMF